MGDYGCRCLRLDCSKGSWEDILLVAVHTTALFLAPPACSGVYPNLSRCLRAARVLLLLATTEDSLPNTAAALGALVPFQQPL